MNWSPCEGSADHAGIVTDLQPRSVASGASTQLTAKATFAKAVEDGAFDVQVHFSNEFGRTLTDLSTGRGLCVGTRINYNSRTLNKSLVTIDHHALECPIAAGEVTMTQYSRRSIVGAV